MTDRGRDDEDLADVADELASELRALREELENQDRRSVPRGPLGFPRPPSPREFLEFADEVAIPGLIAILEANVKLLEALQKAIRLADAERRARRRSREVGAEATNRAGEIGYRTLERVQDGLDDLRTALERDGTGAGTETGTGTTEARPGDGLLADIEALQEELDERIADARRQRAGEERAELADGTGSDADGEDGDGPNGERRIDVDAELESLRDQYDDEDDASDRL
jgi:hypothetical protein